MKTSTGFSSDHAKQLIADTLRLYVGLHRRFSWADLAVASGIKEGTLRSYVAEGGPEMPFHVVVQVFALLPIEARGRVLAPLGVAVREAEADQNATVRRALTQAAKLVAEGNEALEDGEINHREQGQLRTRALDLLPALQALADGQMH